MKHATIVFSFNTANDARIVVASLSPEIKHKIPKTKVNLSQSGTTLSLTVHAPDISSLRAACNSYLRWIQTALQVKALV